MSEHKGLRAKVEGRGRIIGLGAAIAAVVALVVTGSAVAGSGDRGTVTSADIVDGNVRSNDIKDGGVYSPDLNDGGVRSTDIRDGGVHVDDMSPWLRRGRLLGLESDGPYPGASDLGEIEGNQGDNSNAKWEGDGGATLQKSWVQCPDGKTAIGGGYSRADEGADAFKGLQIVTSSPTQIRDGELVYEPIDGDAAGSLVPNGWLVEGFNNNDGGQLIVRPYVVCARVTQ